MTWINIDRDDIVGMGRLVMDSSLEMGASAKRAHAAATASGPGPHHGTALDRVQQATSTVVGALTGHLQELLVVLKKTLELLSAEQAAPAAHVGMLAVGQPLELDGPFGLPPNLTGISGSGPMIGTGSPFTQGPSVISGMPTYSGAPLARAAAASWAQIDAQVAAANAVNPALGARMEAAISPQRINTISGILGNSPTWDADGDGVADRYDFRPHDPLWK